MISNPGQWSFQTEDYLFNSVHGLSVYHRDFPEVRGEGGSPEDAAVRLAEVLSRTLDGVPSNWRRLILSAPSRMCRRSRRGPVGTPPNVRDRPVAIELLPFFANTSEWVTNNFPILRPSG